MTSLDKCVLIISIENQNIIYELEARTKVNIYMEHDLDVILGLLKILR